MNIASRGATMAVDWEQRIDFDRLRRHRLWRERDPLVVARHRFSRLGVPPGQLDAIDNEVEQELEAVQVRSLEAPFPEPRPIPEFAGSAVWRP